MAEGARIHIGTAGWAIRSEQREALPPPGSHLERYGRRLNAVEINSSFYRPHRRATYERWAAAVPEGFAFSVKLPRAINHAHHEAGALALLDPFFAQVGGLGGKLAVVLVQLPPKLDYDAAAAAALFSALRARHRGGIACEPRHPSWFTEEAEALLVAHDVARVAADPAVVPAAGLPGGAPSLAYWRLHGSPHVYFSDYAPAQIAETARRLAAAAAPAWCIFDNTARGAALPNALALMHALASQGGSAVAGRPLRRRDDPFRNTNAMRSL